ncbi:hypothetical protein [Halorussus halobius]|uniref:hypothetical protein n=1 Tax=Halorussus halobius TaxID=1710537 RepID=UPI001093162D|nr:hypothetical protein [Halorussus halobius]
MGSRSRSSGVVRPGFGGTLDWLVVAFGLVLAGVHLSLGVADGRTPFLVVGAGFLLGVGLFASRLWRPILYLVAVAYSLVLGVVWLVGGAPRPALGAMTGAISTAFVALAVYRFVQASRRAASR